MLKQISLIWLFLFIQLPVYADDKQLLANDPWYKQGQQTVAARQAIKINPNKATNVILFVGDGMGISTTTAARIFDGQSRGDSGEENILSFEAFPHLALVKTYNTNQQIPDSAGTSTAIHSGVKTRAGVVGISGQARRANCLESLKYSVPVLAEIIEQKGMASGLVTNTPVTHATPAALYAHTSERSWANDALMPKLARKQGCVDIAKQLMHFSVGDGIDVIFGGGRRHFLGTGKKGKRLQPKEDLIQHWLNAGSDRQYITNAEELKALNIDKTKQVLGLFADSHMKFMSDRKEQESEPTLSEMTAKAIDLLAKNKKGFYLLVEGGQIDKAHHAGIAGKALSETQEFAKAISVALAKVDLNETLILVTADHSHTLTMGGYPRRGNPILGLVEVNDKHGEPVGKPILARDGIPYTTLGYRNGPGVVSVRREQPEIGLNAKQQSLIPTYYNESDYYLSETHAGEDVALYAIGPRAHLVGGVIEQQVIFHIIAASLGWVD